MVALNYDDSASQFVGITLLSLYTVPAVIHILRTILTWKPEHVDIPQARSKDEEKKLARLRAERGVPVLWTTGFKIYVGITAVALVALVILSIIAAKTGAELAAYDPFAILGVASGASDREIKSAYRKMSMLHHPDKGGDAATFQKIAKAYEALTDPVARENWEKYGNPDGKQTLEVAIGIPSFFIGEKSRYVFMLVYLAVLAAGIPSAMHYFWRKNESTKHIGDFDLHVNSNAWLAQMLRERPDLTVKAVPEILSGMMEFAKVPNGYTEGPEEGGELNGLIEEFLGPAADKNSPRMMRPTQFPRSVIPLNLMLRNNLVMHAYLNRKGLKSPALRALLDSILRKVPRALEFMWVVAFQFTMQTQAEKEKALAMNNRAALQQLRSYIEAMASIPQAAGMFVQAVYGRDSDLTQVFPAELTQQIQESVKVARKARHSALVGISDLLSVPRDERVGLLSSVPGITDAAAREYASQLEELPNLEVEAKYEVKDEDFIAEGDIMTLTITLRHKNLLERPGGNADTPVPPVLAPRYPAVRKESWVLYVVENGSTPKLITGVQGLWEPAKAEETVTMMFMAPKAGKLSLSLHVQSMSYVGLDRVVDTVLDIAPRPMPAPVAKVRDEEEETAAPEKTVEAYFGAAEDESDVSDAESDSGDDDADEDEDGAGRGRKAGAMPAKRATAAAVPAAAPRQSASAEAPAASSAAPAAKKASPREQEEELPSIKLAAKKGGKGSGQPPARKASELLGE